jgi:hypothetical protein
MAARGSSRNGSAFAPVSMIEHPALKERFTEAVVKIAMSHRSFHLCPKVQNLLL